MFPWVSTVPFGGPVVPLVYTKVAVSDGPMSAAASGDQRRLVVECGSAAAAEVVEVHHHRLAVEPGQRGQGEDPLHVGQLFVVEQDLRELVRAVDEAEPGTRVAEDVGDLRRRARRVDRHGDGADRQDREIGDVPFRSVRGKQSDPVTLGDTELHQPGRYLVDGTAVVSPVHGVPGPVDLVTQCWALRLRLDPTAKAVHDGALLSGGVRLGTSVDLFGLAHGTSSCVDRASGSRVAPRAERPHPGRS